MSHWPNDKVEVGITVALLCVVVILWWGIIS